MSGILILDDWNRDKYENDSGNKGTIRVANKNKVTIEDVAKRAG